MTMLARGPRAMHAMCAGSTWGGGVGGGRLPAPDLDGVEAILGATQA